MVFKADASPSAQETFSGIQQFSLFFSHPVQIREQTFLARLPNTKPCVFWWNACGVPPHSYVGVAHLDPINFAPHTKACRLPSHFCKFIGR